MFTKKNFRVKLAVLTGILAFGSLLLAAPIFAQADTDTELEIILYNLEEEKLARDVYLTLYDEWGLPIFANIASAEQTHMNAVLTLVDLYGLVDPTAGQGIGVFTNSEIQALYDQLSSQGTLSLADALLVGGQIEEMDIIDLQASLAQTNESAVSQVLTDLLAGSSNHLRAFARTYEQQTGISYEPQLLDQDAFDSIMAESNGNGNGRRWGQAGNGNGPGGGGNSNGGNGNGAGNGNGGGNGRQGGWRR